MREERLEEAPASIADESVRRLVGARASLRAEFAEVSRTPPPLERMKELSAQLAVLDAQIRDAVAENLGRLDNDAQLAKEQVASLGATLADQGKSIASDDAAASRRRALAAEVDETGAALDARVVTPAEAQRKSTFPAPWQIVLLATLAGFALSSAVAAAAASFSAKSGLGGRQAKPQAVAAGALPAMEGGEDPAQGHSDPARRHLVDPEGARPESVAESPPFEPINSAGAAESPEALAVRLNQLRENNGLTVLIAGHRSDQALAAALAAARRLSSEGATLLVDLGATQDWFADVLDRRDEDQVEIPGLADFLEGRASIGEVIRRDLSTSLDVIPSGGDVGCAALDDVFAALASSYDRLVFHASDWRAAPARAAAEIVDAVVVVASEASLRRALDEARETLGAGGELLGLAATRAQPALQEVA